jgi:hypothetical protein
LPQEAEQFKLRKQRAIAVRNDREVITQASSSWQRFFFFFFFFSLRFEQLGEVHVVRDISTMVSTD